VIFPSLDPICITHLSGGKKVKVTSGCSQQQIPFKCSIKKFELPQSGGCTLGLRSVRPHLLVLEKFGVDSSKWNGWAFGPGLERFAMISMDLPDIRLLWSEDERVKKQLKLGNKFKEVSKYPPVTRDISFVVKNTFVPNNYFDLIRDLGGDLVEEVKLLDKYENPEKFGADKVSYTYRIVYCSNSRTLTSDEVDKIQENIYAETAKQFAAEIR